MDDLTGISDSGVVAVGDVEGHLVPAQLQVLRVQDPERGPLLVTWPLDEPVPALEDVLATLGAPGEVKGPSATVWGVEHAEAFGLEPLLGVPTPPGDGEPPKGPGDAFDADEVVDAVRTADDGDGHTDTW